MSTPSRSKHNYPLTEHDNVTLHLDRYEAVNLHWLLMEARDDHQTGDWYGQIAMKLEDLLDDLVEKDETLLTNEAYSNGVYEYRKGERW